MQRTGFKTMIIAVTGLMVMPAIAHETFLAGFFDKVAVGPAASTAEVDNSGQMQTLINAGATL